MSTMEEDYRRDHDAQLRMRGLIRAIDALLDDPHRVPEQDQAALRSQRMRIARRIEQIDRVWD